MKNPTIDEAMAYPWRPKITLEDDGGYKCMVQPTLGDFVIYADTKDELVSDWRDALRVHLQAYIDSGKCIPLPYGRVTVVQSTTTSGQPEGRTNQGRILDLGELLTS